MGLGKTPGETTIERDWAVGKLRSLDLSNKRRLVEFKLEDLSVARQCKLLKLNRSSLYYKPVQPSEKDLRLMRRIDEIYTEIPCFYGYRRIYAQLKAEGWKVGHNKVHRLMQLMRIEGQYPKRKKHTSIKAKEHKSYPYLLKQLSNEKGQIQTTHANQVWSGDITYIPVKGGFMYLAAIIDWHAKVLLAHRLSNTMDDSLVTGVLEEAIAKYGKPEIFNSNQGSQYTGKAHTELLKKHGIAISMNGRRRSIDNVAIERFKYEEVYVKEYQNVKELKSSIETFIDFYNFRRLHSALEYDKPMNVYYASLRKTA